MFLFVLSKCVSNHQATKVAILFHSMRQSKHENKRES